MHSRTREKEPYCREDAKEYSAILLPVTSRYDRVFENKGRQFFKVGGDSDQSVADGATKARAPLASINLITAQMLMPTRGSILRPGWISIFPTIRKVCLHDWNFALCRNAIAAANKAMMLKPMTINAGKKHDTSAQITMFAKVRKWAAVLS